MSAYTRNPESARHDLAYFTTRHPGAVLADLSFLATHPRAFHRQNLAGLYDSRVGAIKVRVRAPRDPATDRNAYEWTFPGTYGEGRWFAFDAAWPHPSH